MGMGPQTKPIGGHVMAHASTTPPACNPGRRRPARRACTVVQSHAARVADRGAGRVRGVRPPSSCQRCGGAGGAATQRRSDAKDAATQWRSDASVA
eukprot:gene2353-13256_t